VVLCPKSGTGALFGSGLKASRATRAFKGKRRNQRYSCIICFALDLAVAPTAFIGAIVNMHPAVAADTGAAARTCRPSTDRLQSPEDAAENHG
jgi:hypothetical protein